MSARRLLLTLAALVGLAAGAAGTAPRADAVVYWTGASGSIWAANDDGSNVIGAYPYEVANLMPGRSACGVAVDASHVYWGDQTNDTVGRMQLSGTPTGKADIFKERLPINQALVTGVNTCAVAVDASHVYWGTFEGRIGRASLDGSGAQKSLVTGLGNVCGIAVAGGYLYWGDADADAIGRARLDGSEPAPEFIPAAGDACGLAVNAAHVYWSHGSAIGRADLDGSDPDPQFVPLAEPACGVAVDASHLFWSYWHSASGAVVGRANLDGSGAAILVSQPSYGSGCGIAVDSRRFGPAAPGPSLPLRFGKLRRQGRMLNLEVFAPERGQLTVLSPQIGWRLDKGPIPPPWLGGEFRWKLALWPGKGRAGKRIAAQLRNKGRAPVALRLAWQQEGRLGSEQQKRLAFTR